MRNRLLPLLLVAFLFQTADAQIISPNHKVATQNGIYTYTVNQAPSTLVEVYPPFYGGTGIETYQWQQSASPFGPFTDITGATASSYSFSGPLSENTYFRRKAIKLPLGISYSNVVKITIISSNWEDLNYIREYDVLTTAVTARQGVDNLTIGQKLQTTEYFDGLGRSVQKISRETATPASGSLWGDVIQFSKYDAYGREDKKYLPYTSFNVSGKYKTTTVNDQNQYYTTNYNEANTASSIITFDNSPLNRVKNIKEPGTVWQNSLGKTAEYEVNSLADDVQVFTVTYVQGSAPSRTGVYPAGTLYKLIYTDEEGKKVIEFSNIAGQLILKKVQLDDNPASPFEGWICTYNIYDEFGLLRYQLQPEAIKYYSTHGWSFSNDGQQVLDGLCFQYFYDNKGRTIWKKAPGANALNMIYDPRDRIVFTQDGNQSALPTPQWTATIYDDLDRPVLTTLYNTTAVRGTLETDISNAAITGTITITNPSATLQTSYNPITASALNNSSINTIVKLQFYDNYSFGTVKSFNTGFTNTTAYPTTDPNVMPIVKSARTISMATGSMTRVLGTNTFLSSTSYYDEKGRHIQRLEDNIKSAVDITTMQYHFDGRILSTCNSHSAANTSYTNYITLTKYNFDKLGRVSSIQKQFGTNAFKTISGYTYDDVGRLKTKTLSPGYTSGGNANLEALDYSYNIHNQITGINKDYALKDILTYNKWSHFFGQYLGYDNRDNVFTRPKLTGQVTGIVWTTMGEDVQRKYDYSYDNAGRLTNALFKEQKHAGDGWSNTNMDFSVTGSSGAISYDLNGNLLTMLHKGVVPGQSAPIVVDNLGYTYAQYSNKLTAVTDQMQAISFNGKFGDFKDGTNGSAPDYVYDANGNFVIDLNKNVKDLANVAGANGIKYNYLDKPEEIRIGGKGTIKIVYSADGEKLQRIFTTETGTVTTTTTSYIGNFIYKENVLQHINFEEGRVRAITAVSQNNGTDLLTISGNITLPTGSGVFDYFVMDYQKNVRAVVTEESHSATNKCTMETARSSIETAIFGQPGTGNEVTTTKYARPNNTWKGNGTAYVSRLGTTAGKNLGPNVLQKVQAGDKITATVGYWHGGQAGGTNNSFANTLITSLINSLSVSTAATELVKGSSTDINTQLSNNSTFTTALQPGTTGGTAPKAYLTVLFFDERFAFIEAADGGFYREQVASSVNNTNGATLSISGVRAPKNGYVYVYISNHSDQDVLFDNLSVTYTAGNLIEENHYYSYGLKIATISAKKLQNSNEGLVKNNYQYQGEYSELDDDIGWNDFPLRNYDPQVGRWIQQDPYQEFSSSYTGVGNDPINFTDPSGGILCPGASGLAIFLDKAASFTRAASPTLKLLSPIIATTRLGLLVANFEVSSSLINGQIESKNVGNLTDDENEDQEDPPSKKANNRIVPPYQQQVRHSELTFLIPKTKRANPHSTDIRIIGIATTLSNISPQRLLITGGVLTLAGYFYAYQNPPGSVTPVNYFASPDNTIVSLPKVIIQINKYGENPPSYPIDVTKPPAPGWQWRGNGKPGSREGSWVNPNKPKEYLRPDLEHKEPIGPHWDYRSPDGKEYRYYPDGRLEPKKK